MSKILLFILTILKLSSTLEANKYCVVNGDAPGIFLFDKKNPSSSVVSQFLDKNTEIFNFTKLLSTSTKWELMRSIDDGSKLDQPVLDQRWESFPTLAPSSSNLEKNNFISFKEDNQWRHKKIADFEKSSNDSQILWKLHDYYYFYTEEETCEEVYTLKKNCTLVENGCFRMYLSVCQECEMQIYFTPLSGNTSVLNFFGNNFWKTEQISLTTNCFNVTIVTQKTENSAKNPFWAFGDIAYFSPNHSCVENKRYINFTSDDAYCETSTNEYIKTSNFPTPKNKKINNIGRSSLRMVRLLFITPVILITTIVFSAFFCILKTHKKGTVTPDEQLQMEAPLNSHSDK